jgi:hypothetical protein
MDTYFQAIMLGFGTGVLIGMAAFFVNWGVKVVFRITGRI